MKTTVPSIRSNCTGILICSAAAAVLLFCGSGVSRAQVGNEVDPAVFARSGKLDETRIIEYLLCTSVPAVPYGKLVDEAGTVTSALKKKAVKTRLEALLGALKKSSSGPEWTTDEVAAAAAAANAEPAPFGIDTPGLLGSPKVKETAGGSRSNGPLYLRRTATDLGQRDESAGATLTWSNDLLTEGGGAWSTQGALVYPLRLHNNGDGAGWLRGWDLSANPALAWQIQETEGAAAGIRDIEFSIPLVWSAQFSGLAGAGLMAKPYYLTDPDFEGGIAGGTAMLNWSGDVLLPFGHYYRLPVFKNAAWKWTLNPMLDWSEVVHEGRWFARKEGDDWLRAGAEAGVAFRPFGNDPSWELSATYSFLYGLTGEPDSSDLLRIKGTHWFGETKEVGLSLEYQRGTTPVSDKEIDLITLGLEVRF